MSEPLVTARCPTCGGTGRLADSPCRTCHGSGEVPAGAVTTEVVLCPDCRGLDAPPMPCERCEGLGTLPACADCSVEPVDPMFAPCCSGVCRDRWAAKQALLDLKAS
ncbi:MAG TPA: hypothetical protein VIV57_20890 [Anaeromyxobacter sp.]